MKPPLVFLLILILSSTTRAALPDKAPKTLGLDPAPLSRIDETVARAIDSKQVPGAVVLVGYRGAIVHARADGWRAVEPDPEPMTRDTVFDLASLTKPVATATSIMILVERGKVRLGDTLAQLWPDCDNRGKGAITVEQLLRHRSGLIADNALADYADGHEHAWERIAQLGLVSEPGTRFLYSDVNFLILGKLVERLSGQPLDAFARENIFKPLGVGLTYRPEPSPRIAPTEKDGETMLRGVVHDPRARALGGVAGHAGLFGTADDLAVFTRMLLDGGVGPDGRRILAAETVRALIDPGDTPARQRRGLGWDVATPFSGPRGSKFGPRSFGHTGFTGTSVWIDPDSAMFAIVLTSRLHPDGKAGSPLTLRAEVATLAASALPVGVACGIDVLERNGFEPLRGKRVGLVTNHTGRTVDGRTTIDVLFEAPGVKLVALFSPEHGIRGTVDAAVGDSWDAKTGLPIASLYGKTNRPTPASLEGVDVLVYDIQDIGTRFYTYISTLGLVLEAAAGRSIPVVVLDRPNPIGGVAVAGPVRDPDFASFVAYHALPVRHGLTVGELAQLFRGERKLDVALTVVTCEGWNRSDLYDRTGLLWVNPSPNMRSLTEALLYPGVGLLEMTNLATGRGTDTPFERVGAPYIEPRAFARALNGLDLPGVRFVPIRFQPKERQYAGCDCGGVQIAITDRAAFEPLALGMGLAVALRSLYPQHWKPEGLLKMVGDRATQEAILTGRGVREMEAIWKAELDDFLKVRARYLLYK